MTYTAQPVSLAAGERFAILTVLACVRSDDRGKRYRCRCDCGLKMYAKASQLMSGRVKECVRCKNASGAKTTKERT